MVRQFSAGSSGASVTVNGTAYRTDFKAPRVAICLDGSQQEYIDKAMEIGAMPNWAKLLDRRYPSPSIGVHALATGVMPSYTNPNNIAIITGTTPDKNGICGNFFFDTEKGTEVMMNDPELLRNDSILSKFSHSEKQVLVVTAKDKLRRMLSHNLHPDFSTAISVEQLSKGEDSQHAGLLERDAPGVYDPDCSIYALELGAKVVADGGADLTYLSTTDYVQHKHAPGSDEANHFYSEVDRVIGLLHDSGAVVGLTADHGMNDKYLSDPSQPNVIFAESVLAEIGVDGRVILPITDPYVVHHGALGSYATIYLDDVDADRQKVMDAFREKNGIFQVLTKKDASADFHLPPDRIGDLVLLGNQNTVIGKSPEAHDLSQVSHLRSHGGIDEVTVPMMFNRQLEPQYEARLQKGYARNFNIFDFLCNGAIEQ